MRAESDGARVSGDGASLGQELSDHQKDWNILPYASQFGDRPLLLVSSDDGLAPFATALGDAVRKSGSKHVTATHYATDHSYSDKRIALQTDVLNWLAALK